MADFPLAVPYQGSAQSVHHFLTIILIVAPLGAMLIPIVGTLLFFTPPEARKRPVFILNIFACCLGLLQAAYTLGFTAELLFNPTKIFSPVLYMLDIALLLLPPLFIDSILIFRFLAFYPVQLTPPRTLAAVLAVPAVLKTARLATLIAFLATYPMDRMQQTGAAAVAGLIWGRGPLVVVLFILQALDNAYASSIFLYKLYRFRRKGKNSGSCSEYEIVQRVPAVFLIALGNYVFPVAMNIAQIALMITMPHFTHGIYIIFANNFVTILGVVFATVWTSQQNWILRHLLENGGDVRTLSSIQFRAKSVNSSESVYDPEDASECPTR
ncbi:hypothetical protein BV25DRAFT_1805383 [Artomyces pyxidatus]|uniref:Uncharacterized protein n=1 Tax=Artomyces pyxidatus TaxID=48021 RepID=A0ACB8SZ55_9AGAM|nr:hypothetical protein BV25DRAFT_1805383 [Artomyces pyxidatus]